MSDAKVSANLSTNASAVVLPVVALLRQPTSSFTTQAPDVDFYRFRHPGALLRIGLDGVAAGAGTLRDPYLGQFETFFCEWYLFHLALILQVQ